MGCELHKLEGRIKTQDADYEVRFLYSPEADDFVSLSDLADNERIPPSEIENWERRLGVEIPKNWN
jgi:major membrane immunogen (membrane-anchored lipoprotein)